MPRFNPNDTPREIVFLPELANTVVLSSAFDEFPDHEDIALWIERNSALFGKLRRRQIVQPIEFRRLWVEAQALLLGLLCRKVEVVSFLRDIDVLIRAARRAGLELSGDVMAFDGSVATAELQETLSVLQDQIGDLRRTRLLHLVPNEAGHRATKEPSDLEVSFRAWMEDAIEIRDHFGGDYYQLEKAAVCLERTFRAFSADFGDPELKTCWNDWLSMQAWLFWRYKNAPSLQTPNGMIDDFMGAKRHLGYLIADDMLARMLGSDGCVRRLLSAERVYYLVSLSVEEFLRTKSYFFYLARSRRIGDRGGSREREDYQAAEQFVYDVLRTVFALEDGKGCAECGDDFSSVLSAVFPNRDIGENLGHVVEAKRRSLQRLMIQDASWKSVEESVPPIYTWLASGGRAVMPEGCVRDLCRHFGVMNMFELLLMCLVGRRMRQSPYEMLPSQARRPPAEAFGRKWRMRAPLLPS